MGKGLKTVWSEDDLSFINANYGTVSIKEMSAILGKTANSISKQVIRLGIRKPIDIRPRKLWCKQEDEFITLNYQTMRYEDIANKLGRGKSSISRRVIDLNLPRQKASKFLVNSSFFDKITPETAYWAGFIAADGCIYPKYNQLSFELQLRDYRQLLKLSSVMGFEGKVYLKERPSKGWSAQMYICDKGIVEGLRKNFNITPRKSLTLEPPDISDLDLALCYAIGYIDGDGTIGTYLSTRKKRKDWLVGMVGTEPVLSFIKNLFDKCVPPQGKKAAVLPVTRGGKKMKFFYHQVRGKRAEALLEMLISLECPHLNRKWDKVREELKC